MLYTDGHPRDVQVPPHSCPTRRSACVGGRRHPAAGLPRLSLAWPRRRRRPDPHRYRAGADQYRRHRLVRLAGGKHPGRGLGIRPAADRQDSRRRALGADPRGAAALGRHRDLHHRRAGLALSGVRSEEHTSELQSLMRISYAVFCLKKKKRTTYTKLTKKNNDTYVKTTYNIHKQNESIKT